MNEENQPAEVPVVDETTAPEPVSEVAAPEEAATPAEVETVAQTVEELSEATKDQEPEPPQAEAPTSPSFDPDLVNRLGELESKIAEYESRELQRAQEDRAAAEKSREALLQEFGILDPLYSRLAPTVQEADPRTPEGREAVRQWMAKHPNLFKKSPEIKELTNEAKRQSTNGNRFGKRLTFGEAIRKIRG
jgi:hypothetical protein